MITAGVLLAAGASRRFGAADKLLEPLFGQPLVAHAARSLAAVQPDVLIAVTRRPEVASQLEGFDNVHVEAADPAQATSLRAGVARAAALGAGRVVITLGDMPFVTPVLIENVISRSTATMPAAASDGRRPMPPACFPAVSFDALLALTGDRGAGALLSDLPDSALVVAPDRALADIDTQRCLDALNGQDR